MNYMFTIPVSIIIVTAPGSEEPALSPLLPTLD